MTTMKHLALAMIAGAVTTQGAWAQVRVNPKTGPSKVKALAPVDAGDVKPQDPQQVVFWLHVLHNNDGESQLINAGPGNLANYGGVARFKTLADNLKAFSAGYPADATEKGWVLISSGDNYLAGPEFNASLVNGVPYYDSLAINLIGYSALALGNHEFDFGPDVLRDFIAGTVGPAKFLSSNLDFTGEPGLQAFVTNGRLARSTVVTVGTQQVGIIGATTPDLPFISSPRNVVVNPVLAAVQAEVTALQAAGVNKIILTSHLQGLNSEFALAPSLRGVDIIIGGGGGELLANPTDLLVPGDSPAPANSGGSGYPRIAVDADGRDVPVVTTRGDYRYIGRLVVGFDAAGNVVGTDSISGPVRVSGVAPDAVTPDPVVQAQVVDPVAAAVAALGANVIATSAVGLDGRSNSVRAFETNLGNLSTDALLYTANRLAGDFGLPTPDVALQNGGGIRNNNILPAGNFTELNTFEVLPFSNFVAIVPNVSPARFKEILENAVSRVGGSGNGRFAQIAGFSFVWDATGVAQQTSAAGQITTPGTRIKEVVLNDGRVMVRDGAIAPGAAPINIATIDFLARGGDQYPFGGQAFGVVGVSYQQSLLEYVRDYLGGFITAQDYPEGGEGRIIRRN
ncbi:MAG: 5'-nucleotidase C-terminal domain-containing protein [Planctomycetota bacterium]|nr:5'-nucleotidase C-terminal domain-containing protein [Planctomycetota bacterium]